MITYSESMILVTSNHDMHFHLEPLLSFFFYYNFLNTLLTFFKTEITYDLPQWHHVELDNKQPQSQKNRLYLIQDCT